MELMEVRFSITASAPSTTSGTETGLCLKPRIKGKLAPHLYRRKQSKQSTSTDLSEILCSAFCPDLQSILKHNGNRDTGSEVFFLWNCNSIWQTTAHVQAVQLQFLFKKTSHDLRAESAETVSSGMISNIFRSFLHLWRLTFMLKWSSSISNKEHEVLSKWPLLPMRNHVKRPSDHH